MEEGEGLRASGEELERGGGEWASGEVGDKNEGEWRGGQVKVHGRASVELTAGFGSGGWTSWFDALRLNAHDSFDALTSKHINLGRSVTPGRQKPWGTPMQWLEELRALRRRERIATVQR